MKNLKLILAALIGFLLVSVAFAQAADVPPLDPRMWFSSPAIAGVVVKFAVDFIRKHILTTLEGQWVIVVVVALSIILDIVGVAFKLQNSDPIMFAIGTIGVAIGVNFGLSQIGGKIVNAKPSSTPDPAVRSRSGL
jgi:hypothetical protein